jgi:DNA polymerase-3 subunit chi
MMQVDFYVTPDASDSARLRHACRLIEQSFLAGQRVLALTESETEQARLDALLWTFTDRAFVPHELLGADPTQESAPVQLAAGGAPAAVAAAFDVVVNLRADAVPADTVVARVIEIIDGEETRRRLGRERFRAYRDRGLQPSHHNLENDSQIGNG